MYTDTDGIVFRQVKAPAGRRMVLIFTRKYGKISVGSSITEGKGRSKAALAVRPFTYGRYDLFVNRGYYDLNSAEVKRSYYSLGENLDKYMYASFVLELAEKMLPEEAPHPAMLDLILAFLASMERKKTGYLTTVLAFEVKALSIMGALPVLDCCSICGRKRDPSAEKGKPVAFSIQDGGIICRECLKKKAAKEERNRTGQLIYTPEFDIVNITKYFLKKPVSAFDAVALEDGVSREMQRVVREYISFYFDIGRLKSEDIIGASADAAGEKNERL